MSTFKQILTNGSGVSSNRLINIIMVAYMLAVMTYVIFFDGVELEKLRLILEYILYVYIASSSGKTLEKLTSIIKNKPTQNNQQSEQIDPTL